MKASKAKARKAGRPHNGRDARVRSVAAGSNGSALVRPRAQIDWFPFLNITAISCLLGAGIIHGTWMVMHFGEWLGAGVFFLGLATAQTLGAFLLVAVPGRLTCLGIAAMNLGTVLVWATSRTVGMPIGPDAGNPAPVGTPDLVATFFEVLSLLVLVPLILRSRTAGRHPAAASRMPPRAYAALGAIPVYALILTFLAVVPAAAGHATHGDNAAHDHATHSHG